jgi:hypothetical protein
LSKNTYEMLQMLIALFKNNILPGDHIKIPNRRQFDTFFQYICFYTLHKYNFDNYEYIYEINEFNYFILKDILQFKMVANVTLCAIS